MFEAKLQHKFETLDNLVSKELPYINSYDRYKQNKSLEILLDIELYRELIFAIDK